MLNSIQNSINEINTIINALNSLVLFGNLQLKLRNEIELKWIFHLEKHKIQWQTDDWIKRIRYLTYLLINFIKFWL